MRLFGLACLLCVAPSFAAAQSQPSPEQASEGLARRLQELAAPKSVQELVGSYQQMVRERLQRDLSRPPERQAPSFSPFGQGRGNLTDPAYRQSLRFERDSLDVRFFRLAPRLTAGAGAEERSMSDHGRTVYDKYGAYGFLSFQLGGPKDEKKGRLIVPPVSTYTESEMGLNKLRVDREEFTRGLKDLRR